jgi:hypothetical protein
MAQMMERLLAKMDTNKEQMLAPMKANQEKMDTDSKAWREEMEASRKAWRQKEMACREKTEAHIGKGEPASEEMKPEVAQEQEVALEDVVDMPVREPRKRRRDQ